VLIYPDPKYWKGEAIYTVSAKMVKLSFSFWMQIREINYKRPDVSFVGFASHAVSDAVAASVYGFKQTSYDITDDSFTCLKLCHGGKAVTILVDSNFFGP
jgi:hypothetical protein